MWKGTNSFVPMPMPRYPCCQVAEPFLRSTTTSAPATALIRLIIEKGTRMRQSNSISTSSQIGSEGPCATMSQPKAAAVSSPNSGR